LIYATGALGFFAVPYTIIVYPMVFLVAPRLLVGGSPARLRHARDFVRGRHGSGALALMIALTGIVATMPYIALQLVGIEAVLKAMGVTGEWPLWLAFGVLAAYTYQSGAARAGADRLPQGHADLHRRHRGDHHHPDPARRLGRHLQRCRREVRGVEVPRGRHDPVQRRVPRLLDARARLRAGAVPLSALDHRMLASKSRDTIKRNMALLPAYSVALGLLALLGYMAIAAGVKPLTDENGKPDNNTIVPMLFDAQFYDWFAGVAFAAIAIGALVPRRHHVDRRGEPVHAQHLQGVPQDDATPAQEAQMSKLISLVVKVGALVVIWLFDVQFALDFQLIGGIIIIQTLPAIVAVCSPAGSTAGHCWAGGPSAWR
jgi:SSS family solute:Na+ symporter